MPEVPVAILVSAEGREKGGGGEMIKYDIIKSKDHVTFGRKCWGEVLKGHKAEIEPTKSIRIYGQEWNHENAPVDFDLTFTIGDEAVYESFNLIYTGTIIAIGAKTVTVQAHRHKNRRLSVYDFSWRNWDFNSAKIGEQNSETMMYI